MFKKPFKIKSNSQVKGSERKTFKDTVLKAFPSITENEFNDFLPKKEALNSVKIVTHDEETVQVYTVQKRPMIFDVRGVCYPTVYFLWKFPKILHAFTTHVQVMTFINSGADLMLPGVHTPPSHTNLPRYGNLSENQRCYVNLNTNIAAVAVGQAAQSSQSMVLANNRGKCVKILHFYGDKLCGLEGMANLPIPNLGGVEWMKLNSYNDDFPALGGNTIQKQESDIVETENKEQDDACEVIENEITDLKMDDEEDSSIEDTVETMDERLNYCFLAAIKYSKSLTLPCLTSNFFKLHMLPACPPNKTLDIKKSSYKKLKPFLEKKCELGVIKVQEIKKGVEAITLVNKESQEFASFYVNPQDRVKKEEDKEISTNVTESYIITANTVFLFKNEGYQKGDTIHGADIRKYVAKYIKENNYQDENDIRLVKPKDDLAKLCKTQSAIPWEEINEKVCLTMKNCFKVQTGLEEIVNKGKVSSIILSVSVRSGNKKVTLINNLELFGIRVAEFAKECQHGVAASTSISKPPGSKCDQLLVQGNQILFVYNLLTEKYKIPKRYIKGLEHAPKKKK